MAEAEEKAKHPPKILISAPSYGGAGLPDADDEISDITDATSPLARDDSMIMKEDVFAMKYKELKAYIVQSGVELPDVCTIQNLLAVVRKHFEWKSEGPTTTLYIDGVAKMITTNQVRKGVHQYDSRRVASERQKQMQEEWERLKGHEKERAGMKDNMNEVGWAPEPKYVEPSHDGRAHVIAVKEDKEVLPFEKAARADEKWWLRYDKGVDIKSMEHSEVIPTARQFCSLGLRCAHVHIDNTSNQPNILARIDFQFPFYRRAPIIVCQTSDSCCTILESDKAGLRIYANLLSDQSFVQCNYIALKEGYRAARFHNGLSLEYQAFCIDVPGSDTEYLDLDIIYPEAFEVPVFQIVCSTVGKILFHIVVQSKNNDQATIRLFNKANLGWNKGQVKLNVILFSCDSLVLFEKKVSLTKGLSKATDHRISEYNDAVALSNITRKTDVACCVTPITNATGDCVKISAWSGKAGDAMVRTMLFTNQLEVAD